MHMHNSIEDNPHEQAKLTNIEMKITTAKF